MVWKMSQNSIWSSIFEDFGVPKFAQKHFLLINDLFKTNYPKLLRQPWVNPAYKVYLKHRNSIFEELKSSKNFMSEFGFDMVSV